MIIIKLFCIKSFTSITVNGSNWSEPPVTSKPHSTSIKDIRRWSVSTLPLIRSSYSVLSNGKGWFNCFSKYFWSIMLIKMNNTELLWGFKIDMRIQGVALQVYCEFCFKFSRFECIKKYWKIFKQCGTTRHLKVFNIEISKEIHESYNIASRSLRQIYTYLIEKQQKIVFSIT